MARDKQEQLAQKTLELETIAKQRMGKTVLAGMLNMFKVGASRDRLADLRDEFEFKFELKFCQKALELAKTSYQAEMNNSLERISDTEQKILSITSEQRRVDSLEKEVIISQATRAIELLKERIKLLDTEMQSMSKHSFVRDQQFHLYADKEAQKSAMVTEIRERQELLKYQTPLEELEKELNEDVEFELAEVSKIKNKIWEIDASIVELRDGLSEERLEKIEALYKTRVPETKLTEIRASLDAEIRTSLDAELAVSQAPSQTIINANGVINKEMLEAVRVLYQEKLESAAERIRKERIKPDRSFTAVAKAANDFLDKLIEIEELQKQIPGSTVLVDTMKDLKAYSVSPRESLRKETGMLELPGGRRSPAISDASSVSGSGHDSPQPAVDPLAALVSPEVIDTLHVALTGGAALESRKAASSVVKPESGRSRN